MNKVICSLVMGASVFGIVQAAELDVYGHIGIHGQVNSDYKKQDYSGLNGSIGLSGIFDNGITIGIGGWAGIPIYENVNNNTDDIYKHIFILSELYFSYKGDAFNIAIGRYDTNDMGYDWFSGHNQGVSLGFNIGNFITIWGLYSNQQAFQFQRFNRESGSQINALWDYRGHTGFTKDGSLKNRKEHLGAIGIDVKFENIFRITPYVYLVTDNLLAYGGTAKLTFGEHDDLYSDSTLKYTSVDQRGGNKGQLFLFDQEFGYNWFKIGAGYYKTLNHGVGRLTNYGDDSRFYGGITETNFHNSASGSYYGAKQSTWYVFTGARHEFFKFDILYASGTYKEFSALLSISFFKYLEFGAGYVDLANIANNKREYVTGFVKSVW